MDFSEVIRGLKDGYSYARRGWNGKGMSIVLVPASAYEIHPHIPHAAKELKPWIGMRTADGGFVPWLASQTDLLAQDWGRCIETTSLSHPPYLP